jgi:hypothetical protein
MFERAKTVHVLDCAATVIGEVGIHGLKIWRQLQVGRTTVVSYPWYRMKQLQLGRTTVVSYPWYRMKQLQIGRTTVVSYPWYRMKQG